MTCYRYLSRVFLRTTYWNFSGIFHRQLQDLLWYKHHSTMSLGHWLPSGSAGEMCHVLEHVSKLMSYLCICILPSCHQTVILPPSSISSNWRVFYLFVLFFWDSISLCIPGWLWIPYVDYRPPDGIPLISVSQRKKCENLFKQILILQFYCPVNARRRMLRLWGVTLYSSVNQMYHKSFLTVLFPRLKPGCAG